MAVWAGILSSFLYKMNDFPTPFADQLQRHPQLRAAMKESSAKRRKFFMSRFFFCLAGLYLLKYKGFLVC